MHSDISLEFIYVIDAHNFKIVSRIVRLDLCLILFTVRVTIHQTLEVNATSSSLLTLIHKC